VPPLPWITSEAATVTTKSSAADPPLSVSKPVNVKTLETPEVSLYVCDEPSAQVLPTFSPVNVSRAANGAETTSIPLKVLPAEKLVVSLPTYPLVVAVPLNETATGVP